MERKICEECNGNIEKKLVDYILLGKNMGKFEAEVCRKARCCYCTQGASACA